MGCVSHVFLRSVVTKGRVTSTPQIRGHEGPCDTSTPEIHCHERPCDTSIPEIRCHERPCDTSIPEIRGHDGLCVTCVPEIRYHVGPCVTCVPNVSCHDGQSLSDGVSAAERPSTKQRIEPRVATLGADTAVQGHRNCSADPDEQKHVILEVLYHIMPHTPCRFEVNDVHSMMSYTTPCHTRYADLSRKTRIACSTLFRYILKEVQVCFSSSVYTKKNCSHLEFQTRIQPSSVQSLQEGGFGV